MRHLIFEKCQHFKRKPKLQLVNRLKGLNNLVIGKLLLCKQTLPRTHYLFTERKMRAVTLAVAPERRTKRRSARLRPGDPPWS